MITARLVIAAAVERSTMGDEAGVEPREKWDQRYKLQGFDPDVEPNRFLRDHLESSESGRALCIAAGNGRNAVFLAARGFQVDAIDISGEGLRLCARLAEVRGVTVTTIQADLLSYELGAARYDLITKFYYYQPQLLERISQALRPGGRFIFQTFSRDQLEFASGPRNPAHFADPLDILPRLGRLRLRLFEDLTLEPESGSPSERQAVIRLIAEKNPGRAQ